MLSILDVYFHNEPYKVYSHPVPQNQDKEPLRILITGASCASAESTVYGIIKGSVFGRNQPVTLILFDFPGPEYKNVIVLASQIVISGFGLIRDVIPTNDPKVAFKDIDVAILLNPMSTKMGETEKFNHYFHLYKNLVTSLAKLSKPTVKVVVAGEMTAVCCMICSQYAQGSIPNENITGLSRHITSRVYNKIYSNIMEKFKNPMGVHIWGINRIDFGQVTIEELKDGVTPEARFFKQIGDNSIYMYTSVNNFKQEKKKLTDGVQNLKWIKYAIDSDTQIIDNPDNTDYWIGSAICNHLKDLWSGSNDNISVSMVVCSDGSYGIPEGLFISFPVTINHNKTWTIIQDIQLESQTEVQLKEDIDYLQFIKAQILTYKCKQEIEILLNEKLRNKTKIVQQV